MKEQLEQRLQALGKELEAGGKLLADLDAKRAEVRQTILRISGAIQVLEELLASSEEAGEAGQVAVPDSAAELVGA